MHEYSYRGINLLRLCGLLRNLLQESLLRIVCRIYYKKTSQCTPPDPYKYYVLTQTDKGGKIGT